MHKGTQLDPTPLGSICVPLVRGYAYWLCYMTHLLGSCLHDPHVCLLRVSRITTDTQLLWSAQDGVEVKSTEVNMDSDRLVKTQEWVYKQTEVETMKLR